MLPLHRFVVDGVLLRYVSHVEKGARIVSTKTSPIYTDPFRIANVRK